MASSLHPLLSSRHGQQGGHGFGSADRAALRSHFCRRVLSGGLAETPAVIFRAGCHLAIAGVSGGEHWRQPQWVCRFWRRGVLVGILTDAIPCDCALPMAVTMAASSSL